MLLSPQWQLASPLCRRRDEARRGHTAGTWQTRGPGLAITLRQEACGRERVGEGRRVRARCRPGPRFPLSFPEGRKAKSPGPGGSVTAPGFFPGGLSFPHQLDAYASFVSQFPVLGEAPALPPHLSLSRLHFSRLVSQGGGGGARGGASSGRLLRNQTTFQDKATPGARHAGGCSRFSRSWAGCLGQGLLGEGAGVPRCSSCSSSLPGQGKHILSTRRATAPGRRVGNWIAPSPTRTAAEEPGKNPEGKGCERATALEGDPDHPRRALLCISLGALGSRHFLAMS